MSLNKPDACHSDLDPMRSEDLFREGALAYRRDDFAATLKCCEELLAQNPDTSVLPAILNLKALALAGKGLLFDALDCIEQAIAMKPDDGALHHHLSRIFLVSDPMPEHKTVRKKQVYESAVSEALLDGGISPKERTLLNHLRDSLGVSEADAGAI